MRSAVFVSALVVLACICLQADAYATSFEKCPPPELYSNKCVELKCHEDGSGSLRGCPPLVICPNGRKVKETDLSKPYPDCCAQATCEL